MAACHEHLEDRCERFRRMQNAILACFASLAVATPVLAQTTPMPAVPTILTTGDAVVRRAPDVAYLTIGVETRAKSPRDAQRQNADAMASVQGQLATAGISKDAQRTLGVWLEQEFDTAGGRRVARGFVARNTLEVRIDDVGRAGELADAVVQGGATSLHGIRFDLKDRAATEREALRAAVADARARADAAAAGAGGTVDRILKIEDSRTESGPPRPFMRAEATAVAAAPTAVEPGLIEIRAQVALTVSMK
jgi:uncharacterized protein YggE